MKDNDRLLKEVQAKSLKDHSELEKRLEKRKKLALQARDFQFVQMKEIQKKRMAEQQEKKDQEVRFKNE
jgi:hypothetical protein